MGDLIEKFCFFSVVYTPLALPTKDEKEISGKIKSLTLPKIFLMRENDL